ncbi:hypothetical protein [Streptomyces lushanensis]|uniref:hypothetical protein n=1 Tax=Streptomyces lushanensis TaxID=1434255 RepID=UPI00082EC66F|nr:hypothetical protein [Streptomyces lushanensis]
MRVKSLIKQANPVPAAPARRGPGRRAVLVTALAGGTAAVVAGVAFLASGGAQAPGGRPPGGGGAIADQEYYRSTERLEAVADLIVRGRLGPGREEESGPGRGGSTYTVAPVDVTATAKGEVPGNRLQLSYIPPGAAAETAPLTAGKEYVFLLTKDGATAGGHYLVSTMQGWYAVDGDDRATPGPENDVPLSPTVRRALRLRG